MIRRCTRLVAAVGLAFTVAACGVQPDREPEPLPPTVPLVQPPSVTQEPAPTPLRTPPAPPPVTPARP